MVYALAHTNTYIKREKRATCQLGAYASTQCIAQLPFPSERAVSTLGHPYVDKFTLDSGTHTSTTTLTIEQLSARRYEGNCHVHSVVQTVLSHLALANLQVESRPELRNTVDGITVLLVLC